MFRIREYITAAFILIAAAGLIWGMMIKPHAYVWVEDGQTTGRIHTILPSNTVIGANVLKALVELPDGSKTILEMPMDSALVKGKKSDYFHISRCRTNGQEEI